MAGSALFIAGLLALAAPDGARAGDGEQRPIRRLSMRLLEENALLDAYQEVVDEFQKDNRTIKPQCRLERVSRILEDPFCLEEVAYELREGLEDRAGKEGLTGLPDLLAFCAAVIDAPLEDPVQVAPPVEMAFPEDHLVYIQEVLDSAARCREQALSALSDEEKESAFTCLTTLLDQFIVHVYLETVDDAEKLRAFKEGLKALAKVDQAKMAEAAVTLAALARSDYLKLARVQLGKYKEQIPPAAKEAGFTGDVIAYRETRHGPIVIGGRRSTRYGGRAAFILDLGGNDTYTYAASTLDQQRGLSMVVDLDGKDRYESAERASLACACLGVSLLIDLKGDDRYEGTRMTQAFGGGGIALLWDERGADRYRGEEYAQGGAFFGAGILVDREGKDTYSAYLHSQGFGLTRGLGALVDLDEDDTYTATGKYPCTYGQEGIFHGASQGHGTGLRRYRNTAAPMYGGGIGALLDGSGDDRYEAGNFSQGCGYFFGCGLLSDRTGDDVIDGTRYSQGTGAHQAAGIVINDEGDDEYRSKVAANQAGTWDITAGMFLDFEGNDSYKADGLAQAGTAQTAFALLFDGDGKDTYQASGNACQGATGSFEYHNKPSISFFLDLGGDKDSYNRPLRKNNKILLEKWYGVFADFKQRSVDHVLKTAPGKLKGEWGPKEK